MNQGYRSTYYLRLALTDLKQESTELAKVVTHSICKGIIHVNSQLEKIYLFLLFCFVLLSYTQPQ